MHKFHFCKNEKPALTLLRHHLFPGSPNSPKVAFHLELIRVPRTILCMLINKFNKTIWSTRIDFLIIISYRKPRPGSEERDYSFLGVSTRRHICGNNYCVDRSTGGCHWCFIHAYDFSEYKYTLEKANEEDIILRFPFLEHELIKHRLPHVVYLLMIHPKTLYIDPKEIRQWKDQRRVGLMYDVDEGDLESGNNEAK